MVIVHILTGDAVDGAVSSCLSLVAVWCLSLFVFVCWWLRCVTVWSYVLLFGVAGSCLLLFVSGCCCLVLFVITCCLLLLMLLLMLVLS